MKKIYSSFNPDRIRELFLVFLIVLAIGLFSIQIPNYINISFINRLSSSLVIIGILATCQTMVFITRNFDLSVGSIVGISAYIVGFQLWKIPGMHPLVALSLAIGIGVLLGVINGAVVSYGRVPAVIATIGTLAIFRTALTIYGRSLPIMTNQLPMWAVEGFTNIVLFKFKGLEFRLIFLIMISMVIIFQLVLSYTKFGRQLYAVGSNPDAARIAGFANYRIVFLAYVISGALAGLAGFISLVRFGSAAMQTGIGLEFAAITAVVIGGVSNQGGSGSVFGAFLGALFVTLLEISLYRNLHVSEFWVDAALGILILIAVIADYVIIGKLRKVWAQRQMLDR